MKIDVAVVGGGVIGCSIALRVARSGLKVAVIDRGQVGREASWAAAGMVAPQTEAPGPGPFFNLCNRSRSLYPQFAAEVTELSGIDVEYRDQGSLCIELTEDDRQHARQWTTWQSEAGFRTESISRDIMRNMEPAITEAATGAVFVPNDHQVDNRRLMRSLDLALRRLDVGIIEGQAANGLIVERNRVTGILCGAERIEAGLVVIAAGCWSGQLLEPVGLKVETIPARGQMVALKGLRSPINHVVHSNSCYVIPRLDGRILVGATVEYVGFQRGITAGGISSLLAAAIEVAPALKSCEIVEAWSGLRPDTADHLPILGESGIDNLLLATGHFRNGILLAPVTAELIAATILGGESISELKPFAAARFPGTS